MWHVRRDENNQERRLLLPGKNNAAKATTGLAYKVVDCNGVGKVEWEPEPVEMTADEAVKRSTATIQAESATPACDHAREWLEQLLESGPKPVGIRNDDSAQPGTIVQAARDAGHAWRTVQRAAAQLGVVRAKGAAGALWLLTPPPEET
jgi:hypothetical protein